MSCGAPEQGKLHHPRASDADRYVCWRVREVRTALGLSQQRLARVMGISYQQLRKYERGQNRISAGRLYCLAQDLKMPIEWFFEGLAGPAPRELTRRRTVQKLARDFGAIENERHREALCQVARLLAS